MAKVTFGGGIAAMSGKIGGQVAARNKGGAYMRTYVKPTQPHSPAQEAQRSKLAGYSQEWRTMTDAQRSAWNTYAGINPVLDRLGNSIILTGSQQYVKCNTNRDNAGDATTNSTPPTPPSFVVTPMVAATLACSVGGATLTCDLAATAAAAQVYIVYAAAPVSAGVTNTVSDERMIGTFTLVAGDIAAAIFPDMTAAYVAYFGTLTGKEGLRATVAIYEYDEGQLGSPSRQSCIIAA